MIKTGFSNSDSLSLFIQSRGAQRREYVVGDCGFNVFVNIYPEEFSEETLADGVGDQAQAQARRVARRPIFRAGRIGIHAKMEFSYVNTAQQRFVEFGLIDEFFAS